MDKKKSVICFLKNFILSANYHIPKKELIIEQNQCNQSDPLKRKNNIQNKKSINKLTVHNYFKKV